MSNTDWEAIERGFRAGLLSNAELGRKHGVTEGAIRKRAKRDGWTKDLTAKVQQAVRAKAVRAAVRGTNARTDAEIVEEYAEVGAAVIEHHRAGIRVGRSIVANLMDELRTASAAVDDIETTIEDETAKDGSPARRAAMLKAVSLPSRAATIRELSQAMRNLVGLERQAFNLDATDRPPSPLEGLSADELGRLEQALAEGEEGDAEGGSPTSQP